MALVKFYRGLYAKYDSVTHADGVYFATDKQLILMNGTEYGGVNMSQFEGFVKDVNVSGNTLTFKKDVGGVWTDTSLTLVEAGDNSVVVGNGTNGASVKVNVKSVTGDGLKLGDDGLYVDLSVLNGTGEGSVTKKVNDAIAELDVSDSAVQGSFVNSVSETDGKISVSKGTIGSTNKTVTVGGTGGNVDLAVNVDGTSIVVDSSTGKLSVANSALIEYEGSNAIKVSEVSGGKKTISLGINNADKVLTQSEDGLLTNITLVYDSTNKKIQLLGKNSTEISTIDASDFIKDGMLAGETVFTATATSQEVTIGTQKHTFTELTIGNTYIAFIFKIEGKTTSYSWDKLDVTTLVDVYKNGDGLNLDTATNTFSVKKDSTDEGYLSVSANGIKVSGVNSAIATAKAEAKTVVAKATSDAHITVTSTTDDTDGHVTYYVGSTDTASATTLNNEIAARKAIEGQSGTTYAADSTTNYIKTATSLTNADMLLDAQVKKNADAISNLPTSSAVDTKIATAINALDVSAIGGNGKVITTISETDGKISATAASLTSTLVTRTATVGTTTKVKVDGTTVEAAITSLATSIKTNENAITTLNGANTVSGSVKNTVEAYLAWNEVV
jgi:hypothetical protein